ncbi:hypothetical protein ASE00_21630 [Sphingomonas sp. Root710]|nr:hypothetical protein ASE00_21630 [Sphingomonas sp. Root710]
MPAGREGLTDRRLTYLFGSDHQRGIVRPADGDVRNVGSTDLWRLRTDDSFLRLHIPGNFPRLKVRPALDRIGTVLNLITDPDLNPKVLGYASRLLREHGGRVINRPEDVLRSSRDRMADLLDGIDGLIVPRVARFRGHANLALRAIESAGLRFPAILRAIGTHNGEISGIVASPQALAAIIDRKEEYFLTEFVESRDQAGLYHKIRLFFFGPDAVFRHRIISDQWNVHGPDRERFMVHHPAAIALEREMVQRGLAAFPAEVRSVLQAVRARVPLDYFGIDFALMSDGRLLLFEANATMNFFSMSREPPFDYFEPLLAEAQAKFTAMIEA